VQQITEFGNDQTTHGGGVLIIKLINIDNHREKSSPFKVSNLNQVTQVHWKGKAWKVEAIEEISPGWFVVYVSREET